ncbi:hypothetical protein [Streptomyces sp. NPDC046925]|uniref:hypothetical protein n=1 Tax=Streptomyces sp. NPDC046925 TaxID=3155375 RepID=UPI0033E637A5
MTKPAPARTVALPGDGAPGSCGCLCETHPEFPGPCRGYAEPGLTAAFDASDAGPRQVPLCRDCHDIRMGLAPQRDPGLEGVTDTCTCHCRANHPEAPGICEAASDGAATIGGEPVCRACADAGRSH